MAKSTWAAYCVQNIEIPGTSVMADYELQVQGDNCIAIVLIIMKTIQVDNFWVKFVAHKMAEPSGFYERTCSPGILEQLITMMKKRAIIAHGKSLPNHVRLSSTVLA